VFGRKSKQPISPMGASLRFQLNSSTLSDISATGSTPSISRMSSAWSSRNHVGIETSILVINCIDETPLFVSNGAVYADLPIEMNIPFPIGRRKVQCLSLAKEYDLIRLCFEETVILAFPSAHLVALLLGQSVKEYGNAKDDMFGAPLGEPIYVAPGEEEFPVLSKVAKKWFSYENTAAKVMGTPLDVGALPISLDGRSREEAL